MEIQLHNNVINQLSVYRHERLSELISVLFSNQKVSGILLGGSLACKKETSKSDIDLFCLIDNAKEFETTLKIHLKALDEVDEIIRQGFFAWTENLHTLFYKQDMDLTIDLCLIDTSVAKAFFWEPSGYILFDKNGLIEAYRKDQMKKPCYTQQPFIKSNPFSLSIITLKKIEKNLARNHIWNALEQLNILRRYIMQVIRIDVIKNKDFLGRVDRDIEDILPERINEQLIQTIAKYDTNDIAQKTILLIKFLDTLFQDLDGGSEKGFANWFSKQLRVEKKKLAKYISYA